MRRTASSALLALLASAAAAQDQRPLPGGAPDLLVHPALRVHVIASEDLDPDRLRALACPDVTLWLRTRSNALRDSTLENVDRFDEAFVQLRLPLKGADVRQLARAPRSRAWLDGSQLSGEGGLPLRRVAIEVRELDEARAQAIARARPALVRWSPVAEPDLMAWALFRQLPGRKIFAPRADQLLAVSCASRDAGAPSLELHVATLLALSSDVFPCGRGTRVIVEPTVDRWLVQSLLVREPSLELVLDVGADDARASKAKALLTELGFAGSR